MAWRPAWMWTCSTTTFLKAASDALALVAAALRAVRASWCERRRYRYSKAGVTAVDLVPLVASQRALPGLGRMDRGRAGALMGALDERNARYGREAVVPAAAGFADRRGWAKRATPRSPRYTTRLDELPLARA